MYYVRREYALKSNLSMAKSHSRIDRLLFLNIMAVFEWDTDLFLCPVPYQVQAGVAQNSSARSHLKWQNGSPTRVHRRDIQRGVLRLLAERELQISNNKIDQITFKEGAGRRFKGGKLVSDIE